MKTLFFYDLETSGLSARYDRIMQFAGQRTTLDLEPIGDPVNLLIKLDDDTLPSPSAIMVTKITPQSTALDGLSEREFCAYALDELFTPNTIAVGYNSVRFDDDFMRHLFWRNFCDPYAWEWKDGRGRWDLLDVVRLVRALRPDGITWPLKRKVVNSQKFSRDIAESSATQNQDVAPTENSATKQNSAKTPAAKNSAKASAVENRALASENQAPAEIVYASNRLEYLTKLNNINHDHAHDALSDVFGLIGVAKLLKTHQPKIYDYLFQVRDKVHVAQLVNLENPRPFVYASGRYENEFGKTTVAYPICAGPNGSIYVYDLRYNLEDLPRAESPQAQAVSGKAKATSDLPQATSNLPQAASGKAKAVSNLPQAESEKPQAQSAARRRTPTYDDPFPIVKKLMPNKCPAVAPLGVLDLKTAPAVEVVIDDFDGKKDQEFSKTPDKSSAISPDKKSPKEPQAQSAAEETPQSPAETSGWQKIGLTKEVVEKNLKTLLAHPDFIKKIAEQKTPDFPRVLEPEAALYNSFLSGSDEILCSAVRNADATSLKNFNPKFADPRLPDLLVHYKARNFPDLLSESERESWEKYRFARLNRQAENFLKELSALAAKNADDYLVEELKLWYESLQ